MEKFLREHLYKINPEMENDSDEGIYFWQYDESVNKDALSDAWLENRTSYIYKVGVLCAIDSNKCDFVHIAIGVQRSNYCEPEVKGTFYFNEGENDDMGRVMERAFRCLRYIHPAFDPK